MNPYASPSGPGAVSTEPSSATTASATWAESEPTVRAALTRATKRLVTRSRASWPIWVGIVAIASGGLLFWRIRHPPPYTTDIVLRIAEGAVAASPEAMSSGALRAYIFDLALSRSRVATIVERHAGTAQGRKREPSEDDITDLLDATKISIVENDFIEDREATDPPRSVRVELTFRSADADVSWTVAHELADLLVDSERARRTRAIAQHEAIGDAAMRGTEGNPKGSTTASAGTASLTPGVRAEVESAVRQSARAKLDRRSLQENQSIRFEVVATGRHPSDQFRSPMNLLGGVLGLMPLLLFAAALVAGAFDPRVLDAEDLSSMGIVVLGKAKSSVHRV